MILLANEIRYFANIEMHYEFVNKNDRYWIENCRNQ